VKGEILKGREDEPVDIDRIQDGLDGADHWFD
jgi:hypothetical protein